MRINLFTSLVFLLILGCEQNEKSEPIVEPTPIGKWEKTTDFPGVPRTAPVAFTINGKGYVGTGSHSLADFYAFDPTDETWAAVSNIPNPRTGAIGFSINGKGYVMMGEDSLGYPLRDVWEYDPIADTWTQKNDFPADGRYGAAALVLGDKAYLGTGWSEPQPPQLQLQKSDWWEYDPATDSWTSKASFPGGPCSYAAGIGVGGLGYLGIAGPGPEPGSQWWAYNPNDDTWTEKASLPGKSRYGVGIFAIDEKIIAAGGTRGLGSDPIHEIRDCWAYDTMLDKWILADSLDMQLSLGVSFSINNIGYYGVGFGDNGLSKDFLRFKLE